MENTLKSEKNWTDWFEIPVTDMSRAKKFYETIFETHISVQDLGPLKMGIFAHKDIGCAICEGEWYVPSTNGTLVYLKANPDLALVQGRIESAGGHVIMPKKQISPTHGFMAVFIDTEGNRLALHSDK
jgi:uncharacterized protein